MIRDLLEKITHDDFCKTYDYIEETISYLYNETDGAISNVKDVYNKINYTDIFYKYKDNKNKIL